MSLVVCNAGPLIALSGIGCLDLIRDLFGSVEAAEEVRREVEAGGPSGLGKSIFTTHPWLRSSPLLAPPDPLLSSVLDSGEAATISLSLERGASLVLMDERKGRKIARDVYQLPVAGTGRVLVEAKRAGLIAQVKPLLRKMEANGYWLSIPIQREILRQAGE